MSESFAPECGADNGRGLSCERARGHDGPHEVYDQTVTWTDGQWVGTPDDRSHTLGRITYFALAGPAWHIAERLAQIIEANPDMAVEGNTMVYVMPPLTEEERQAQFNARAEGEREDDGWEVG